MPAAAQIAPSPEFDSVKSILTELKHLYEQQSDIRETLDAKGVPAGTVNMLINLLTAGSMQEFSDLSTTAVKVAADKYGKSAVQQKELEVGLRKIADLDEDAVYVRRIAKGMELNAQAISMLTNIIRQNPGDGGQRVLTEIFDYATEYGIKVEGLRVVEGGAVEPKSVLPNIVIPDENSPGLLRFKGIIVETVIALLLTYTALSLLT